MVIARLLAAGLVAVGLTACRHASSEAKRMPARAYSAARVRRAFAGAGLPLTHEPLPLADPRLVGTFGAKGGVAVIVYRNPSGPKDVLLLGDDMFVRARNVVATYPRKSPLLPKLKRAFARLKRDAQS